MEPKNIKQMFSGDPQIVVSWCKEYDITHQELAERAKITPAYFSMIVSGARPFVEPSKTKIWKALISLVNEREIGASVPNVVQKVLRLDKTPQELVQEQIELLKMERDSARAQVEALQKLVAIHEARTNWDDVNLTLWNRQQEFEEMLPQFMEILNKLTNGIHVSEAEAQTLEEELLARFPKTIAIRPEEKKQP